MGPHHHVFKRGMSAAALQRLRAGEAAEETPEVGAQQDEAGLHTGVRVAVAVHEALHNEDFGVESVSDKLLFDELRFRLWCSRQATSKRSLPVLGAPTPVSAPVSIPLASLVAGLGR